MPPDKPLRAAGEFESDFTEDLHKNPHQIGLEDGNHVSSQPEPFDSGDMWVLTYQPAVLLAIKQFFAGAVAGACAKTAIAPLDRAKILFQVSQEPFSYRSLVRQLRSTVRNEGFIALYKGNLATVSRYVTRWWFACAVGLVQRPDCLVLCKSWWLPLSLQCSPVFRHPTDGI